MKYVVKVEETLRRHFIVEADDEIEAEYRAQEAYDNGWIVLDYDDYAESDVECRRVAEGRDFEFYDELEE